MSDGFKERVLQERNELAEKLTKLTAFIEGSIFATLDAEEQARLRSQRYFMDGYLTVLRQRIEAMQ